MKKIKNYLLVKKYPWLQCKNVWNGKKLGYEFTWYDDIPQGWRKAFGKKMIKELNNILKKANYTHKYQISQIKEKWGYLHWYDCGVPEKISKEYDEWLDKYEELSKHICIVCGKDGEIDYKESWLSPLCVDCRRKMDER